MEGQSSQVTPWKDRVCSFEQNMLCRKHHDREKYRSSREKEVKQMLKLDKNIKLAK